MTFTDQQNRLLEFVKVQHGTQVRKYTGEPYWHHVVSVAEIVHEYSPIAVEAALRHDLLEDTKCTREQLLEKLESLGYDKFEAYMTVTRVDDLTDVFTSGAFPNMNRKIRKELEAERLSRAIATAQTVKYADLIDNTSSIVEHDPKFAKIYLQEKELILSKMRGGNQELRSRCLETLEQAKKTLMMKI